MYVKPFTSKMFEKETMTRGQVRTQPSSLPLSTPDVVVEKPSFRGAEGMTRDHHHTRKEILRKCWCGSQQRVQTEVIRNNWKAESVVQWNSTCLACQHPWCTKRGWGVGRVRGWRGGRGEEQEQQGGENNFFFCFLKIVYRLKFF